MKLLIDIIKTEYEKIPESFWSEVNTLEIINNNPIAISNKKDLDDVLVICDDPDKCRLYRDNHAAILVYLWNGNREKAFSDYKWMIEGFEDLEVSYLKKVYLREKKLPLSILETKRLFVRETTEADVPVFYQLYQDPSITKYMEKLFDNPEEELAYARNYRDYIYEFYDFGMWTVLEKQSGQIIGRAGISMREGFEEPELGFMIGKPYQNKGYAYEVCKAILNYSGQEFGFKTIICFVKEQNEASLHLCKKLEFQDVGTERIGKNDVYRMLRRSK